MRYLSIEEAARVLGLSRSTLYKKTSAKSIPFFKFGGQVLFEQDSLMRWVRADAVAPIGYDVDFFGEGGADAA
jgi:excisionase family DNA binding protein